jgi:hypothetical protein
MSESESETRPEQQSRVLAQREMRRSKGFSQERGGRRAPVRNYQLTKIN